MMKAGIGANDSGRDKRLGRMDRQDSGLRTQDCTDWSRVWIMGNGLIVDGSTYEYGSMVGW